MKKFLKFSLILALLITMGGYAPAVFATATVTPATGGSAISADTTGGSYAALAGPIILEGATADIGTGTIILNAPSGFNFNTVASSVTATRTDVAGTGCNPSRRLLINAGASQIVTPTATTITINITRITSSGCRNIITWTGIQVRPTAGTPLASGNIVKTGTSSIVGVTNSVTNFGALTEVAGAKNKLAFTTEPSSAATIGVDFATKPVVTVQDQFGNTRISDSASTISRGAVLSTQACGGTAGSSVLTSIPANGATVASGVMNYTAMQYSSAESIKICASSTGVTSALSNAIVVSKVNTTTVVVSSGNPSVYGQPVTFTATVTPANGGPPSGTVTFKDGPTTIGTGILNGANPGVAVFSISNLSVLGSPHSITAVYGGDSNFNGSTSSTISQTITGKSLTVSGITASDKLYDGNTTATLIGAPGTLVGVMLGDDVSLAGTAIGTFDTPDVGAGKTVTISGQFLAGVDAPNYTLIEPTTVASITNNIPTITSINPTFINTNDPGFTLTVNGSNFVAGSTVNFNGFARVTTYVSSTQLTVAILNSDLITAGTFPITVTNPAPGGGTSNAQTFTVTTLVLSPVTVVSNNANISKAKVGDIVTLTFASNGVITSPTVAFKSGGVNVTNSPVVTNTSGNTWTATYTTNALDADGLVTFTINFNSAVGTSQASVVSTTDASSVTFDKTPPTLTPISIISSGPSSSRAKVGAAIALSFTSSETIQTPSVTFKSGGANVTGSIITNNSSGNDWMANYVVDSADTEGATMFTIDFSDLAGNVGVQVVTTTDSSGVIIDKTFPTLATVSISSSNINPAQAVVGDVATLSFTSSETIQTPSVTFKSGGVAVTNFPTISNILGNNWTAAYTINGSDTEGLISFLISPIDLAGNVGTNVTITTDSSSVTFQVTPTPTPTPTPMPTPTPTPTPMPTPTPTPTPIPTPTSSVVPSPTPTPTPTISTPSPSAVVSTQPAPPAPAAIRVQPTRVNFSGRTCPGAQLTIIGQSSVQQAPLAAGNVSLADGSFNVTFEGVLQGYWLYGLLITDQNRKTTQTQMFSVDTINNELTKTNLVVSPTSGVLRSAVTKGDFATVLGCAVPGSKVQVYVDDKLANGSLAAGSDGMYKLLYTTANLDYGRHTVQAKQSYDGKTSDLSPKGVFTVSSLLAPKTDLNADGIIDIKDWSIFLSLWNSNDINKQKPIDFNGDGVVDARDFSIFVRNFK